MIVKRRKTDNVNVLIVDDNEANLFAFEEALSDLNCNITVANSGQQALQLAVEKEFALILLDVQMPEMDGFEVATLLKKNKQTKKIPLIFVTAFSKDDQDVRRGLSVGAIDYILKPVDPIVLSSKVSVYIDQFLQNKKLQQQLEQLNQQQENLSKDNAELKVLAKYDQLTGLYNRLSFNELLADVMDITVQKKVHMALLYLDLDDFKAVNDNFGHAVGDELLRLAAFRMREVLRTSDVVLKNSDSAPIARLGGDEFAIILPDLNEPSNAEAIAQRLVEAFKKSFLINDGRHTVGVSIGVAVYPEATNTAKELCTKADEAMYAAKKAGKHAYRISK